MPPDPRTRRASRPTTADAGRPALALAGRALGKLDLVSELLERATGPDLDAAMRWVGGLRERGLSSETLFLEVFEPAARRLGDLWERDRCSQADVTFADSAMLRLVRRLGSSLPHEDGPYGACRSALVALPPRETHELELGLTSEYFTRAGWDVDCAFPRTDRELGEGLSAQHVDVLTLCLSGAFDRRDRLASLRGTVTAARRASRNRQLAVLVAGRAFFEEPNLARGVGADAGVPTAAQAVGLADRLAGLTEARVAVG